MKSKKLGLFIPTYKRDYNRVSASIWIRVLQLKKYYEMFGIKVYINNPFIIYDIAIVYRASSSKILNLIKFLKKTSKKVYWDTCVNYYDLHSHTNSVQVAITKEISKIVDGVIVSTNAIEEKAKLYNNNVFVMDDPIDRNYFKYKKDRDKINFKNPIFGWSGVSIKAKILNNYKNYIKKLLIISDKPPILDVEYEFYKWRYESFPYLLTKCDIALLPREFENDPYNIAHSSFKALVFAMCEIPIIANKLPSYEKLAEYYGGIVFLEDVENDIEKAIEKIKNSDLSNKKLLDFYSCENQAFRLLKYLGCI